MLLVNLAMKTAQDNFGFNLVNFTDFLLNNSYDAVVSDYEKSFIGSFVKALFNKTKEPVTMSLDSTFIHVVESERHFYWLMSGVGNLKS